jgi:lipoprotein-anchoring transpeptidase ErfK/SrfK
MSRSCFINLAARVSAAFVALALQACAQTIGEGRAAAGAKRVEIDKTVQLLRAYEGEKLVFESRVSTGRSGRRTPSGTFTTGIKLRMHYSTLYDNAPMPYSVQVKGNYFIHGYKHVPDRPASHGCIRLPLDGDNPAKWFFEWVEPGTPITITGEWNGRPKAGSKPRPAATGAEQPPT